MINLDACVVFLIKTKQIDKNLGEAVASVASMVVTALLVDSDPRVK
jgi:hypothetical protein